MNWSLHYRACLSSSFSLLCELDLYGLVGACFSGHLKWSFTFNIQRCHFLEGEKNFSSSNCVINYSLLVCHQDHASDKKFPIADERVSHLLPSYYQDRIVRVYAKKPELVRKMQDIPSVLLPWTSQCYQLLEW